MNTMRHMVAGMVFIAVMLGLLINAYTGLEDNYNITRAPNDTKTLNVSGTVSTGNIVEQFRNLDLIEAINELQTTIIDLPLSTGTIFDVAGGLLSIGISATKIVTGIVTLPIEMVTIIGEFYGTETSGMMLGSLVMIIVVYVGFILLSAYVGKDI